MRRDVWQVLDEVLHLTPQADKHHAGKDRVGEVKPVAHQMLRLTLNGDSVTKSASDASTACGRSDEFVILRTACRSIRAPARAGLLASAFLSVALGGCGMSSLTSGIGGGMFGGGTASKSANQPLTNEKMLTAAKSESQMGIGGDLAGGCPRFQVWPRDHHVTIYETGRAGDGLAVMHRGEITQTARECQIEGTRVTVKYGFSGRVLLGPRGKAGTVTLPVKIFVSDAKRERIQDDQGTIDVAMTLDKPIGYFSAVKTISFSIPEGTRPGEFEVFVGFDQKAPGAG